MIYYSAWILAVALTAATSEAAHLRRKLALAPATVLITELFPNPGSGCSVSKILFNKRIYALIALEIRQLTG